MRNSLNVALPVTANFIDPLRWARVKAARASGNGCGKRKQGLRLQRGHSVTELTLPADRSVGDCSPFRCLEGGWWLQWDLRRHQPSGGCRILRKQHRHAATRVKSYDCLSLCLWKACPFFNQPWLSRAFSLPHFRPTFFSGPFRSCCRLTPYGGCSAAAYFCVPYLRGMKTRRKFHNS